MRLLLFSIVEVYTWRLVVLISILRHIKTYLYERSFKRNYPNNALMMFRQNVILCSLTYRYIVAVFTVVTLTYSMVYWVGNN